MCLLGVSMMNNHIYGSKVPQNPHFGGLNSLCIFGPKGAIQIRYYYYYYYFTIIIIFFIYYYCHFKPNMRTIQIAISSDLCIRLT